MNFQTSEVGRSFWIKWVAATTIAVLAGGMIGVPISWSMGEAVFPDSEVLGSALVGISFGIFIGGSLALGQWVVLQAHLPNLRRWVPYSAAAAAVTWAAAFTLMTATDSWDEEQPYLMLIGFPALMGAAQGIAQWRALRPLIPGSAGWILVSAIGVGLGLTTGMLVGGEGREVLSLGAFGLLTGAITGAGMLFLLRRPAAAVAARG